MAIRFPSALDTMPIKAASDEKLGNQDLLPKNCASCVDVIANNTVELFKAFVQKITAEIGYGKPED